MKKILLLNLSLLFAMVSLSFANGVSFEDSGITNLTGVYYSSLAWGDYDNDGDLDLAISGNTGSVNITKIYKNLEADSNTAPSPPTNLTDSSSGDTIFLTWDPGSDDETTLDSGLYYNLRLGTTPGGNDIVSEVYGSPLLGNYLRPKLSGSQLGVKLNNLPPGTYYWSVQTIDTGLMKSDWSEEASFVVGGGNITGSSGSLPVGPLAAGISAFLVWWKRQRRKQRQV